MTNARKNLTGMLNRSMAYAREQIEAWTEKLNENPLRALEWSREIFEAAAQIAVLSEIASLVEGGADPEKIRDWVTERALWSAAHPPESTSPFSNLAEQYKGKAYAKALEEWIPKIRRADEEDGNS